MRLAQAAPAAVRLAVVSEKSQAALSKALTSWFTAQFITGAQLQRLRAVHQAGAYAAFAELLGEASDVARITLLKKVDKHRRELLVRSRAEMMSHIEKLASGEIEPAEPPTKKAASKKAPKSKKKQVGIISTSRY